MPSIQDVRAALPAFKNESLLIKKRQGTGDIIYEVLNTHKIFAHEYDEIYQYFDTGEPYSTGQQLWDFLKYNLSYNAEPGEDQTVRSPAAILHQGEKVDCKHYSLFAGGVLDAIKRNMGDTWTWCYRFASEDGDPSPTHVFVVINDNGTEYWLDPCLSSFDANKKYRYFIDKTPKQMALRRISGLGDIVPASIKVQVDPKLAMDNFLTVVNSNDLGIKDLLLNNPDVTNNGLKNWWTSQGGNWNDVLNALI